MQIEDLICRRSVPFGEFKVCISTMKTLLVTVDKRFPVVMTDISERLSDLAICEIHMYNQVFQAREELLEVDRLV